MHLLMVTGITVLFLMPSIQPLTAGVAEPSPTESSVCVGKIGEMYCRTWEEFVKVLRHLLDDCKSKAAGMDEDFMSGMQLCLKNKTVASLDRMLRADVIPLIDGLELVRYISNDTNRAAADGRQVSRVDEEWRCQVLDRVAELFRSHVIRLRLEQVEGRGRHQYKHLFPLMMFAFMKMLVILVPLGFQFMAVISGKALLLSKMALALASAQAMKKVTSAWFDVYHAPHTPYYHHLHRSYHTDPGHPHHLDFFNTPPLQTHFQGFQPTLTDLTHMPSVASAAVVQAPQHQDASYGHNLAQVPVQQDHQPAAQEYQFVFTGGEHQGIQYPQVPSVYDPAEGLSSHGEERLDKKYGNRMNHSYQRNRNKRQ